MTQFKPIQPLTLDEIAEEMDRQLPTVPRGDAGVPALENVRKRGGSVNVQAVLKLQAEAFVAAIYQQILGREPDTEGLKHHLEMLGRGHDKQNMLIGLRESPEGALFGSTLVGVRYKGRLDRVFGLPVIGRFIRAFIIRLPSYRLRQAVMKLEDQIQLLELGQTDLATKRELDTVSARVDMARNRLEDQRRAAEAAINRIVNRAVDEMSKEPWAEPMLLLADRQEETTAKINALGSSFADAELINEAVRLLAQAYRPVATGAGWSETGAALVARAAEALRLQEGRIYSAERLAEKAHVEMLQQNQRLNLLLETVRRRSEHFDAGQAAALTEQQDHLLDALYVDFESRFRGSRAVIKERQRVHLPVMREADAGSPERAVVDVGAGRGEWLELLKEDGLNAYGIDLNATMVKTCSALGLDCVAGDAVAELAKLPEASLGAVTGFHIVEHLPFRVMVALLDEALRVLKPGGVILFETPNPANLQVGSHWFYLDPTHRNPLPGEMLAMIAEARGFVRVRIQPLHPMTEKFDSSDKILGEQLDALLHGPMDYALIAYKA